MSKTLHQQLDEAKAEVARLKKMTRTVRKPVNGWFGGIIQQHREARGWTLHELARRSDVSVGLLSRVESNPKSNPTLNNLLKISKALDGELSKFVQEWENELKLDP